MLQRILQSLLRDVGTSRPSTLLVDSVQICQARLKKLDDVAKPIVVDLHAGKREKAWRSLKAAFRGNKIEQLRGIRESAKTTLLLAKQETSGFVKFQPSQLNKPIIERRSALFVALLLRSV